MDLPEDYAAALVKKPQPWPDENARAVPPQPGSDPGERRPYYWPDQSDIELSKKYDTLYGSPYAGFANPGNAVIKTAPLDNITAWRKQMAAGGKGGPLVNYGPNTQRDADIARSQAIAAERSALAKLGWDPGQSVSTPPGKKMLSVYGLYDQNSGADWHDQNAPNAALHEAMHRGFRRLNERGLLPKGVHNNHDMEEMYVRALMQKAYGDVELQHDLARGMKADPNSGGYKQIVQGRRMAKDPLMDSLEAAAAQEVARRHPGGPR